MQTMACRKNPAPALLMTAPFRALELLQTPNVGLFVRWRNNMDELYVLNCIQVRIRWGSRQLCLVVARVRAGALKPTDRGTRFTRP